MSEPMTYTEDDKKLICKLIWDHARVNGYAQVGWATSEIGKQLKRQFGHPKQSVAYFKSIESLCTQDKEFISEPVPNTTDFYIKFKPSDKPKNRFEQWFQHHPFLTQIILALIAASLSLIVGVLLARKELREQTLIDTQQDLQLEQANDSISNLRNDIEVLQDSLKKR